MDASFHIKQPQKRILVPGILYQEQYAVLQNVTFKLLLLSMKTNKLPPPSMKTNKLPPCLKETNAEETVAAPSAIPTPFQRCLWWAPFRVSGRGTVPDIETFPGVETSVIATSGDIGVSRG